MPTATPTAALVSTFPSLQHLHLSAFSLSENLLKELSQTSTRLCPLSTLQLELPNPYVVRIRHCYSSLPRSLPELSSEAWSQLVAACPRLQVLCTIGGVCSWQLQSVFKPEVPLVCVKVTCVRGVGFSEASFMLLQYRNTLHSFEYITIRLGTWLQVQVAREVGR